MIPCNVIGSYPPVLDKSKYADAYLSGGMRDPSGEMIRNAVNSQLEAGIDIISDGQTRADFISLFARNFKGVLMQRRPVVVSEIEYKNPVTVEDQEFVRKIIPKETMLKGIITGPYTLAKYSENRFYNGTEELAYAYAEGLNNEARALDGVVDFIQVDEPEYSIDYPEYAGGLLDTVFKGVSKIRMLHSCGDVSHVFEDMVELNVDVLEHEFAANPELLNTVKRIDFKQKLGYGCLRSDKDRVEPVDEVKTIVRRALDVYPPGKILLNPDCGLRNLPPRVAFQKLRNMVEARNSL
ncbi:MAG: uroporphyrinogen decarboxylase family protein [Candidatus Altiarchaeota archaeon]